MSQAKLVDLFCHKHREYLACLGRVHVAYDRDTDTISLAFQANTALPPAWIKSLCISIFHDSRLIQETVQVEWIDTEGSLLVAVCPRPRTILTDEDTAHIGKDILPIGDVVLFAGDGAYERVMHNDLSARDFSQRSWNSDEVF